MPRKSKKIVKAPPGSIVVGPKDPSPESLIKYGMDKGVPVETMERLLAMRTQIKAEQAREAFNHAMSRFQRACPIINKTKQVKNKNSNSVRYSYAPLEDIVSQVRGVLSDCGLNYSFDTSPGVNGDISVKCTIRHVDGHQESSSFSAPIDKDAYMNAPQKVAATHTYAKRYALCDALGILTANEDDDANSLTKEHPRYTKGENFGNEGKFEVDINPQPAKKPVKKAAEKKKSSHDTTKDFGFLRRMKDMKDKVGAEMYYEALKFCGFSKANLIVKRNDQVKVWNQLQKIIDSQNKSEEAK